MKINQQKLNILQLNFAVIKKITLTMKKSCVSVQLQIIITSITLSFWERPNVKVEPNFVLLMRLLATINFSKKIGISLQKFGFVSISNFKFCVLCVSAVKFYLQAKFHVVSIAVVKLSLPLFIATINNFFQKNIGISLQPQ